MSKSTYKPQIGVAPWALVPSQQDHSDTILVQDKRGTVIARMPGNLPVDYAHGKMIEALPDLMAALEGLLEWGRVHTGPKMANSPHALLVSAQAALQKARQEEVTLLPYLSIDPHRPFVPDPVFERGVTDQTTLRRINNECRIALEIARHAVARGLWLWVDYGEGYKPEWTQDLNVIRNNLSACDEEWLQLAERGENGKMTSAGWFFLVYGNADNGSEVVSDYGITKHTEALDKLVEPLVALLEQEG